MSTFLGLPGVTRIEDCHVFPVDTVPLNNGMTLPAAIGGTATSVDLDNVSDVGLGRHLRFYFAITNTAPYQVVIYCNRLTRFMCLTPFAEFDTCLLWPQVESDNQRLTVLKVNAFNTDIAIFSGHIGRYLTTNYSMGLDLILLQPWPTLTLPDATVTRNYTLGGGPFLGDAKFYIRSQQDKTITCQSNGDLPVMASAPSVLSEFVIHKSFDPDTARDLWIFYSPSLNQYLDSFETDLSYIPHIDMFTRYDIIPSTVYIGRFEVINYIDGAKRLKYEVSTGALYFELVDYEHPFECTFEFQPLL